MGWEMGFSSTSVRASCRALSIRVAGGFVQQAVSELADQYIPGNFAFRNPGS